MNVMKRAINLYARYRSCWIPVFAGMILLSILCLPVYADSGDDLLLGDAPRQAGGKVDLLNPSGTKDLLNPSGTKDLLNPSSDGAAAHTDTHIDPKLCNALVKHTPSADTAYQPGVDSTDNPVTAPDLPAAPQMALPCKIQIPLTVSLAKVLNLNTSQYPYSQLGPGTEANIGTLTVEGDTVTFNGQPLS